MRRLFAPVAFAAVAFAIAPSFALADDSDNPPPDNGLPPGIDTPATVFDLGIDVSGVPHNPTAVRTFLGSLAPVTQSAIMGACENYMAHPEAAQSEDTYAFCSNAVRG